MTNNLIFKNKGKAFCLVAAMFLIFVLFLGFYSAQSYSRVFSANDPNVRVSPAFGDVGMDFAFDADGRFDRSLCEVGQDFILQIHPLGCSPAVVRSDLLERGNVQVYCPIVATKINPLVTVNAIDHITFARREQLPPEVSGIGYYPARAALGRTGKVTHPTIMENVGYVVVNLRQTAEEDLRNCEEGALPGKVCWVEGNLTATIRYDVENAFGIGRASFYLPVLDDRQWEYDYKRFGFWQGRGYLRAESIDERGAAISVYSGDHRRLSSVVLGERETSHEIFIPGFDYCMGGMTLRLDDLVNPDTSIRMNVNGDYLELRRGDSFLDNRCRVTRIEKNGLSQSAIIRCHGDDRRMQNLEFSINPRVNITVEGVSREYGFGDILRDEGGRPLVVGEGDDLRTIYVGRITTRNETLSEEDLVVNLIALRGTRDLTDSDLENLGRFFDRMDRDGRIPQFTYPVFRDLGDAHIVDLRFSQDVTGFEKNIKLNGFVDAVDRDISDFSPEFIDNYQRTLDDLNEVLDYFAGDRYPSNDVEERPTLGRQALEEKIEFLWKLEQRATVKELCEDFERLYEESLPSVCRDAFLLSNAESNFESVFVGGKTYSLSMHSIREPGFREYGAEIYVRGREVNQNFNLGLDDRWSLGEEGEFFELERIEKDRETGLNVAVLRVSASLEAGRAPTTRTIRVREGERATHGFYSFEASRIHLEQVAKVSLIPRIEHTRTDANLSFKIGIETRAINLTPDQTKSLMNTTRKLKNTLEGINNVLGPVVSAGRVACLTTGIGLAVKNFVANLDGKGVARQNVMRGSGGWYEWCEAEVRKGDDFPSVERCLLNKSSEIDKSVDEFLRVRDEHESLLRDAGCVGEESWLGERAIDTETCLDNYAGNVRDSLGDSGLETIRVHGEDVLISEIAEGVSSETISLSRARDIDLNSRLAASDDDRVREVAESQLRSDLTSFWVDSEAKREEEKMIGELTGEFRDIGFNSHREREPVVIPYRGFRAPSQKRDISEGARIHWLQHNGTHRIVELEGSPRGYTVSSLYSLDGRNITEDRERLLSEINSLYEFRLYDRTTYRNPIAPEDRNVRYFETGEYKGLPSVVPFDLDNGWYVAVKRVMPVGGAIQPYDPSGRASSFYLCNVGANGRINFHETIDSGTGEDICQMINVGIGQPHGQFFGLTEAEARRLVGEAQTALQQAGQQYQDGVRQVTILGNRIEVGDPAVGVPDVQCEDFMSPRDCNILFNVCDPVVCPPSRCNLGGSFYVDNVIQSGVAGSIALCLPNFPEVKVPVCVSGVHAGLEGYISMLDSFETCLEESLERGVNMGICSQLKSIYICETFWREGRPLAEFFAPRILGGIARGTGIAGRTGGGEYMDVQQAWEDSGQAVDFFTQQYATQSFAAFQARSTEGVGTDFCRNWVSIGGISDLGTFMDNLMTPDSPTQYWASFERIEYTRVTDPPQDQYSVFYHIFAGQDSSVNYMVYLRGDEASLPAGASPRRVVDQGVIPRGSYVTDRESFVGPSGYRELCIVVDGKEDCGFKEVSTDFGIQWMKDQAAADHVREMDIERTVDCYAGTVNALTLNPLVGVEERIDPSIYNRGITRVCATDNPGQGTNPTRWKDVGYCDSEAVRCWLDTDSVKEAIAISDIQEEALGDYASVVLEGLRKEEHMLDDRVIDGILNEVGELETQGKLDEAIKKITEKMMKGMMNYQKGRLHLERGRLFAAIAKELFEKEVEERRPELKGIGERCERDVDCESGFCVDGVCAEEPEVVEPDEPVEEPAEEERLIGEPGDSPARIEDYEPLNLAVDFGPRAVFPVPDESLDNILWNFGNRRQDGARCHAGIDINTRGEGNVVAITGGTVKRIYNFYKCDNQQTVAVLVEHKDVEGNLYTVNYGEIDHDKISVGVNDEVSAGDVLGKATYCGMLHFELYKGSIRSNIPWFPPSGVNVEREPNYCARQDNIKNTKPEALWDPTNTLRALAGKDFLDVHVDVPDVSVEELIEMGELYPLFEFSYDWRPGGIITGETVERSRYFIYTHDGWYWCINAAGINCGNKRILDDFVKTEDDFEPIDERPPAGSPLKDDFAHYASRNFNERDVTFIRDLSNKNYVEGIELLLRRTFENEEDRGLGQTFLRGLDTRLRTTTLFREVDLSSDEVFKVSMQNQDPLYLKHLRENVWEWSVDGKRPWHVVVSSEEEAKHLWEAEHQNIYSKFKGLSNEKQDLIYSLRRRDETKGAEIIFGYNIAEQEPIEEIFMTNYPIIIGQNEYYTFFDGEWYLCVGSFETCKDDFEWGIISQIRPDHPVLQLESFGLIKSFVIERPTDFSALVSTQKEVEFNSESKIFTIKLEGVEQNLYLKFDDGLWWWSFDGERWAPVNTSVMRIAGISVSLITVSEEFENIRKELDTNVIRGDLEEGLKVIFELNN